MFKKENSAAKRAKINGDIVHYDYCLDLPTDEKTLSRWSETFLSIGKGNIHDINGNPATSNQMCMFYVKRS